VRTRKHEYVCLNQTDARAPAACGRFSVSRSQIRRGSRPDPGQERAGIECVRVEPSGNGSVFAPIRALNIALHERDEPTHDHCDRVEVLAVALGRHVGLAQHELQCLRLTARLHDIGKIGIPDDVLKKPGRLSSGEWLVMQSHAVRSERIIRASMVDDADVIARAARHHHERYDGRGYPDGLAGDAIPLYSRIVAIVDTYDAMARLRAYGQGIRHREIMAELARVSGEQHDAYLSRRFAEIIAGSQYTAE
jgi:HD-GYP domain-containing protein (c-di-GMP phosphodiesterase class II)